jgi:anti-anti-sigma regulatory factor
MNAKSSEIVLELPAIADLTFASTLKELSEQALAGGKGLVVDATAVRRIASPCLQILISALNSFAKSGGPPLTLSNPSPDFLETVSTLGLEQVFGLTKV